MENNKFNLNLGDALECGDKYVDSLIETMNIMKEQISNPEILEVQLNEIRRDARSYTLMLNEFNRLIKEKDYQAAFNQFMINSIYEKFRDDVLPGNDMSVITDYLNELDENEIMLKVTHLIEEYILKEEYDEYELLGYRSEYKHANDCEMDYINEEIIITLKRKERAGGYYEIRCYEEGEDLGYSYNTRGYASIERVEKIFITSKIKEPLNILIPKEINGISIANLQTNSSPVDLLDTDNCYFEIDGILEVDYECGDDWYPSGYMKFTKDRFEEPSIRQMSKRPVWIFKGESGLGKSYLSSIIERMGCLNVFETDSIKGTEINEKITADIIIIGNKHGFDIEYIKLHVPELNEVEFIEVDFSK